MVVLALILGLPSSARSSRALVARTRVAPLEVDARARARGARRAGELLQQAKDELERAFKARAADALRENGESFLQLARAQFEQLPRRGASEDLGRRQQAVEHLVKPIRESLERVDGQVKTLEQSRRQDYGSLLDAAPRARRDQRAPALRDRHARDRAPRAGRPRPLGRDAAPERRRGGRDARALRLRRAGRRRGRGRQPATSRPRRAAPGGGKHIVVDAKVPLQAYLDALEARDGDARASALDEASRGTSATTSRSSARRRTGRSSRPRPTSWSCSCPARRFFRAAHRAGPVAARAPRPTQRVHHREPDHADRAAPGGRRRLARGAVAESAREVQRARPRALRAARRR